MAEVLSFGASIVAILQLTEATINYLKDVHEAPRERMDFFGEISGLQSVLRTLKKRVDQSHSGDPWLTEVRGLGVKDGPLDKFRADLSRLVTMLGPMKRSRNLAERLTWKFTKAEIKDILYKVERTKSLIDLALTNDILSLSQAIKEDSSTIKDTVTKTQVDLEATRKAKKYSKIIDWLSPLSFEKSQSKIFGKRQDGTGRWLIESHKFKEWRDGTSETLWCPGMPGAGKSVLTSIVVNHLQNFFEGENVAIAYIYCNYKEQADQTDSNLVASILKQIVQVSRLTFDKLESLYKRYGARNTRPGPDEFMTVLKTEIGRYSKVFIVVDALDECSDGTRTNLLRAIRSLPGTINLMVTSRYLSSIEADFRRTKRLVIRAHDQDLRMYIAGRIARASRRHLTALQETITDKIINNVDGMFLLAQLHMDSVVKKHNTRAVHNALQSLTKDVDDAYDEAMERIERQDTDDKELAKQVLLWITYAIRPLSVNELEHALAVLPGQTSMDLYSITDEEILTSVCAGLVVIDDERSIIHLVHYTTQQYFERKRDSIFPNAEASITATCLTYLSFDVFGKGYCQNDLELKSLLKDYPLLDYAAEHWGDHAHGHLEENTKNMLLNFLSDDSKILCPSQVLLVNRVFQDPGYSQEFPRNFSGMHMASFFGLTEIVKYQLEPGGIADLKDGYGQTLLFWAAECGHEEVVRYLTTREDVKVDSRNKDGQTPLSRAAKQGHKDVVRLLVMRDDVEADLKDEYGGTPLSRAAEEGHEEVVRLLVEREDVDVNSKDLCGWTPLAWAAGLGYEPVVRLLLSLDSIEADLKDIHGRTPLSWAAELGFEQVVMLLAACNDVEVDLKDNHGWTPLSWSARRGQKDVVRLLAARDDVNADSKDMDGRTPLSWAAGEGHEQVVRLLLEAQGVKADSKDKDGWTPLSWATKEGHKAVARLLET